jgi:hypothetical protein
MNELETWRLARTLRRMLPIASLVTRNAMRRSLRGALATDPIAADDRHKTHPREGAQRA